MGYHKNVPCTRNTPQKSTRMVRSTRTDRRVSHALPLGFTVVELMITLAIVAIGVALALPSWLSTVEKRSVVTTAENITSFLSFAQSEAIKRNDEVTVSWYASGGGHTRDWCIGATLGATACDCRETVTTEADFCAIEGLPYRIVQTDFVAVDFELLHFHPDLPQGSFAFDPVRGLIINNDSRLFSNSYFLYLHNDMKIDNKRLYELQVKLNITGRISICADDDRRSIIGGYGPC